jgi:hypothetical protein
MTDVITAITKKDRCLICDARSTELDHLCDVHRSLINQGFMALVELEEKPSEDNHMPERSGNIVMVPRSFSIEVLKIDVHPDSPIPMAFVEKGFIGELASIIAACDNTPGTLH